MMEVISTRRYEARPAASAHSGILVDPENSVATVKEEEWETRKKKEITTTRQIETRVKRQVVLEDGEVVVDSGPLVTTNTTEDVEQQEHTTQERRTTGDEPKEVEWPSQGSGIVQKELNETVVRSREEVEERLETEDRQQLGDISDEAYQHAIRNNRGDLRVALAESSKQLVPQSGPRVLQHTTKSKKVIDTENKLERKALQEDGLILTETKKTVEHEEIKDDEVPDDGTGVDGSDEETRKECSQRFLKKKDEDVVDYVSGGERVAREMRYISEETEGERIGDWPPPPTTMRTARLHKHGLPADGVPTARKDALTKKPLDLEEEDEARKVETSKWLESHFGSESRSSHGSLDPDDPPVHTGTNTSFINVTMKSLPIQSTARDREYTNANSSRHRVSGRDSNSPSGYFHGISEWSERYQGSDKQNNYLRTSSPSHYATEPVRSNGYLQENSRNQAESSYNRTYESSRRQQEYQEQQRHDAPSPPLRRRVREQLAAKAEEKNSYNDRTSSPVHVVQRTWESRSRNVQGQNIDREGHRYSPQKTSQRSRSTSPIPAVTATARRDKKSPDESVASRASNKTSSQSKYKIGESFRKLVGKLRSASTERKNKRSGGSTSQLTQTDDSSTYLQYNVIDRNIPLVSEYDSEDKPPERPPRSPKTGKVIRSAKVNDNHEQWQRNDSSAPPVHRYYLGEDPFGGSIYGREKGYRDAKPPGRQRAQGRFGAEAEYSVESNSLGRFSKSTSRLANDYDRDEQFRSVQTLPRKLHYTAQSRQAQQSQNQRHQVNVVKQSNRTVSRSPQSTVRSNKARQYGSMINISIKNAVTAPKGAKRDQYPEQKHGDIGKSVLQGPAKPERTYKSSLSRSKSFNVEASRNGVDVTSPSSIPYKSNLQLNRLDENPAPLKSPGILASISRSNRDLFKAAKYEY